MQLRPYQLKARDEIYRAWAQGAINVLVQMSTGAGKTVLFSQLLAEEPDYSIAIAHRVELVSQISLTLARYGIRHNIIAQKQAVRNIITLHMTELGKAYYDPNSKHSVAGVDTLLRLNPANYPWFEKVKLVVQDEGHHPLKTNKWGKAAALFQNARGLYPTATPVRADGFGLGRHADGLMDALVVGPAMRDLIREGYLSDYKIIIPPSDLDLSNVPLSASGDFSPPKLRTAVHKSRITGSVIASYLKFAAGKLGVTFAVDIKAATEIALEYKAAGIAAEIISSKTPDLLRAQIMRRFQQREILQLVNVDLLGEGVDVPAIEVVSMARPTQSYGLYAQQFGRALRPMAGKTHAIIIDHVGNVVRHNLPDKPRLWSLDRRERRARVAALDVIPLRNCLNPECLAAYERVYNKCPYCGFKPTITERSSIEVVDGDLIELDAAILAKMRGEIVRIDSVAHPPAHLDHIAQRAVIKRHGERQEAQILLRESIALWAGYYKALGAEDSEIYRRFYFAFNIDILSAQTLGMQDATELNERIKSQLLNWGDT